MSDKKRAHGDNILVLGATSAIAQETCRILATRGCEFFLVDRDNDKLGMVAQDLKARGAKAVHFHVADLGDFTSHQTIINAAKSSMVGIDCAFLAYGVLGDATECMADFRPALENIRVNFVSVVSILTPLANMMAERKRGMIAVISSVAGDRGRQSHYTYNAAKGALSIWLQGLRNRLAPTGVHVLTIKPGMVDSPMTAHLKKGFLFSKPSVVGAGIVKAMDRKANVAYVPCYWKLIMLIIIHIPECIFKRMKL